MLRAAGAHIAHDRKPGRGGKRPHHVEARDAATPAISSSVNGSGEMGFDIPERLLGRIHRNGFRSEACASWTVAMRFI
jgi:hypothetical protein